MNLANYRYDGNGRAQSTLTILDISLMACTQTVTITGMLLRM